MSSKQFLDLLKDLKKNERGVKELLIGIHNKIIGCLCKLIAECYLVIDIVEGSRSEGSVELKLLISNWILLNAPIYCAGMNYKDIYTLKTSEEKDLEETEFLLKLYTYLFEISSFQRSLADLINIRNSLDDSQILKLARDIKDKYENPPITIETIKDLDDITVLAEGSDIINDSQDQGSGPLYKTTFKDIQNITVGRKIYHDVSELSRRDAKTIVNMHKHMYHQQLTSEDIPIKDLQDIKELCKDPQINLASIQNNITVITNLWKQTVNFYKIKGEKLKNARHKIYYIAYAIKLIFPDKSFSSLATAIRNIEGINSISDPLYNMNNGTVSINVHNYYNNFFSEMVKYEKSEEYKEYKIRNDNNFQINFNKEKIISLIETNAYETPNPVNLTEHLIHRRRDVVLRLKNMEGSVKDKAELVKNITKLINNYLHYFKIDDKLRDLCPNFVFARSKPDFTPINKDIIEDLLGTY